MTRISGEICSKKNRAEHPFGHIKHDVGIRNLLLRGREGQKQEYPSEQSALTLHRDYSHWLVIRVFEIPTGKPTALQRNTSFA